MPETPKQSSQRVANNPHNFVFTININQNPGEIIQPSHIIADGNHLIKHNVTESHFSDTDLVRKIRNIENRRHLWSADSVRKECSPMVNALLKSEICTPTIDEGSEINCIDSVFAKKVNLYEVPTACSATAAGNTAMVVTGQTRDNVVLHIPHSSSSIVWDLSKCVVVENLGVDVLIGEPGKVDNMIITKSHLKKIETKDEDGHTIDIPYFQRKDKKRFLCRAIKTETLLPGEALTYKLPPHLQTETQLALAPTRENVFNFVKPQIT